MFQINEGWIVLVVNTVRAVEYQQPSSTPSIKPVFHPQNCVVDFDRVLSMPLLQPI